MEANDECGRFSSETVGSEFDAAQQHRLLVTVKMRASALVQYADSRLLSIVLRVHESTPEIDRVIDRN